MTNLEAIKSTVAGYPLSNDTFNRVLLDRGVLAAGQYSGSSQAFELAKADLYMTLVTAVQISEGGYQLSLTDKSNFMKMADAIYNRYSDAAISRPKVRNKSQAW
jgi:hypothetical protein